MQSEDFTKSFAHPYMYMNKVPYLTVNWENQVQRCTVHRNSLHIHNTCTVCKNMIQKNYIALHIFTPLYNFNAKVCCMHYVQVLISQCIHLYIIHHETVCLARYIPYNLKHFQTLGHISVSMLRR